MRPNRRHLLSLLATGPAWASAPLLRLATLEWPPYVGLGLPQHGASAAVVAAALAAEACALRLEFMPWPRALREGSVSDRFDGYFPAYASADRDRTSWRSPSLGASRVGFARRRDEPLNWRSLDDLAPHPIGVVRGYVNEREFDRRAAAGLLQTDATGSDVVNLRKLASRRTRLAVVDEAVFYSLLGPKGPLADLREQLVFDTQRLLEEKPLYIYFQRNSRGRLWLDRFQRGLQKIDAQAVFQQALAPPPL